MTLQEHINGLSFSQIEQAMLTHFPDQARNLAGYEQVCQQLTSFPLIDSDMGLYVRYCVDTFSGKYIHASSVMLKDLNAGQVEPTTMTYSLLGESDWEKIASSKVFYTPELANDMPSVVAALLFELTFFGYEPKAVSKKLSTFLKA